MYKFHGALQSEILHTIYNTYTSHQEPNPLTGTDMVIFVLLGQLGNNSPLAPYGSQVDGLGFLNVLKSCEPWLDQAGTYVTKCQQELVGGFTFNWSNLFLTKMWMAHEFGHYIAGLPHHPLSDPSNGYSLSTYYPGVYSGMRGEDIDDSGCLPFSLLDLLDLTDEQLAFQGAGWYEDPIHVTSNMKRQAVYDVRRADGAGRVYRIDIQPFEIHLPDEQIMYRPQYFLVAYHSGALEDAEPNANADPLYPSTGLQILHCAYSELVDIETAFGRFSDPGDFDAGHWQLADPILGYDNLDVFPDNRETYGLRNYAEYHQYPGSPLDFFRGGRNEFSYRTNPSSLGHEPFVVGVTQYPNRLAQSVENSVMVRIREDHGDSLIVDFLLAPYEDIVKPNGGEELMVGQPDTIAWDVDTTLDIASVDIALSRDGGVTYTEQIATGVANNGEYIWTPVLGQVTAQGRIKITYHNSHSENTCDDESDAVFAIKSTLITYENQSGATAMGYTGVPYSSVTMDYNDDGKKDVFITMRSGSAYLGKQDQLSTNGVPHYYERTLDDFAVGSEPPLYLRGVSVADYDNDGDVDMFAAAASEARLYDYNGAQYVDVTSAEGVSAYAQKSWAGVWGDYDRDGQVDLFICRNKDTSQDPTPGSAANGAIENYLLRNDMRGSGTFVNVTTSCGMANTAQNASIAASWADIDGDNDLDLFVGDMRSYGGTALCRLYVNADNGTFTEEYSSRFSGVTHEGISSVSWSDMNNDGRLDLVLGSHLQAPQVCLNIGSGYFGQQDMLEADLDAEVNGVTPLDHDLDGRTDLIVLPRSSAEHPWLFSNRVPGTGMELIDESWQVGLDESIGRVDGMVAADFNHDGDGDLYFGRAVASNSFFYQAVTESEDPPAADWVGVRLVAGDGNNHSAIGAKVKFKIGTTFQQLQVVDGGSGRGGQADSTLICGLGNQTGTVQAVVKWPGGYEQTVTLTRNQVTTITDATTPTLTTGSISGTYTAHPGGTADWVFTWETNFSCNPALDKVTITDRSNPPQCESMGTLVLTPATTGIVHAVVAKPGGGYCHSLTWPNVYCNAPCGYNYTVESATDAAHKSTSTSRILSIGVCLE